MPNQEQFIRGHILVGSTKMKLESTRDFDLLFAEFEMIFVTN